MSKWFTANKISLKIYKTNVITFLTKNSPQYPLNIGYNDEHTEEGVNIKFLCLHIDNHLNCSVVG
jgi:hypothetical protein